MQSNTQDQSIIPRWVPVGERYAIGGRIGRFRVTIKLAGTQMDDEMEGDLFESTDRFANPKFVRALKQIISDEIFVNTGIESSYPLYEDDPEFYRKLAQQIPQLSNTQNSDEETKIVEKVKEPPKKKTDKERVQDAIDTIRAFPFGERSRVLILDEGKKRDKHIIIQLENLKNILDYAKHPSKISASLLEKDTLYHVSGWGVSLPNKRKPASLGECYIHWFTPDDETQKSEQAVQTSRWADAFSEILALLSQTVDFNAFKKAKDQQLKAKEDTIKEYEKDLKTNTVFTDEVGRTTSTLKRWDKTPIPVLRQVGFTDFCIYAIATLVLGLIGQGVSSNFGWFVGAVLGLIIGGAFTMKRK